MRISRAVIAGVVMVTAARGLAIAAVSDRPGTAIESSRCPHPSVGWSQKALLPIVKGPDFEGVVLPPKAARAVLCQCSRKSLGPASGYWTPTLSELLPMEARLPDYLRAHAHPRRPDQWRELKGYLRQYLGIARAGRRLIYINGIGGPEYVYSVLTGFEEPPAEIAKDAPEGKHYNPYFANGHWITMAPPLTDGQVTFDGLDFR